MIKRICLTSLLIALLGSASVQAMDNPLFTEESEITNDDVISLLLKFKESVPKSDKEMITQLEEFIDYLRKSDGPIITPHIRKHWAELKKTDVDSEQIKKLMELLPLEDQPKTSFWLKRQLKSQDVYTLIVFALFECYFFYQHFSSNAEIFCAKSLAASFLFLLSLSDNALLMYSGHFGFFALLMQDTLKNLRHQQS